MALRDLYRVERGERGWVLGLASSLFVLGIGSVMLTRLLEAFVIKRIGVGYVPHLHLVGAIVAFGGSWATLRIFRRWKALDQSGLFALLATGGAFALAFTQSLFTPERSPAFNFLFVILGVLVGTLAIATAANKLRVLIVDVLTYEQLDRLTPIFSTAATLSVFAGGLILSGLSERLTLRGMYLIVAFITLLSVPAFVLLGKLAKTEVVERVVGETKRVGWLRGLTLKPFVKDAGLRRFLTLLGVIVGLSVVFMRLFTYGLDIVANERFPTESELNGFFGTYTVLLSLGSLVFINYVQPYLFRRYGLTNNLFTPPLVVLMAALAMFFYPFFWFVVIAVYLREIIIGIQDTAYDAMLEGVNDHHRNQAWSWIRGPVTASFDVLGSLVLLGVGFLFLPQGTSAALRVLAMLAVAFLLIRMLLTIRFKSAYPQVLLESLRSGDFKTRLRAMEAMVEMRYTQDRHLGEVLDIIRDEEEPPAIRVTALRSVAKIQDPSVLRVVARFIDHPDEGIRKAAVRAVAAFTYDPDRLYESGFSRHALLAAMRERFPKEKDPEIVNAVIDALIALRDPEIIPFLIEGLHDRSPEIRHSVLRSLRRFGDPAIIDHVKPFLDDEEPHVRSQAVAVVWQFPWERRRSLRRIVREMLSAPAGGEERRQGYYLAGTLHLNGYRKTLREALADEDGRSRLAAAIALLKLGDESGASVLRAVMREGTREEAHQVERLAGHRDVPERQQALVESYVHRYHLHYPPGLPVSEPLRVRLKDVPRGCLEGLRAYYRDPEAAEDRRKIEQALRRETFPENKGRVVLVGLPEPWNAMAAVALLADGWLTRESPVDGEFSETDIVVSDIESERFPSRSVLLTDRSEGLTEFQVAKSHYAPSELVTAVRKLM